MCLTRIAKPSLNTVFVIRNKHPQSSNMGYMSAYELVTPCCSPPLVLVDQLSCFLHCCTTALVYFTLQNALLLCVDIKMCVQNLDVLSSLIVGDFIHSFRNAFAITGHRHAEICYILFFMMLGSSTISGSLCLHLFDKYHFSFLITNIVTSHHLKPETVGILLDDQLDVPTGYFMIYLLYLYHELKNSRSLLFLNDLAYTFTVIIFVGWLVGGQEKDEPSFTQNYLYLYACGWLPFMYPW